MTKGMHIGMKEELGPIVLSTAFLYFKPFGCHAYVVCTKIHPDYARFRQKVQCSLFLFLQNKLLFISIVGSQILLMLFSDFS